MRRTYDDFFNERPHRGRKFLLILLILLLLTLLTLCISSFAMSKTVLSLRETVTIVDIPTPLDQWSILLLSDLNGSRLGTNQATLGRVTGARAVSCVVLAGNMVGASGDVTPVLELLEVLPQGAPVLLLPGDADPPLYATSAHGSLSPYADWAQTLKDAGVTLLDEPVSFTREKKTIWFIPESLYSLDLGNARRVYQSQLDGLNALTTLTEDQAAQRRLAEYQIARFDRIEAAIASMKEEDIQVAVSGSPLTRDYIAQQQALARDRDVFSMKHLDLVVAGGTCAGQWRIPGAGAIWAPEQGWFPEDTLLQGKSYLNGVWQVISPGLGVHPDYPWLPFRIFNSPAVTTIYLTSDL